MKSPAFRGKRATGCVTYLKQGSELVIYEVGAVQQKWSDETPLMIVRIEWDPEAQGRNYLLRDARGTIRKVRETDLAEDKS